jgi:hypothetical protein
MATIAELKKKNTKNILPLPPKGVAPSRAEPEGSGNPPARFASLRRGFGVPQNVNKPL